MPSPVRAKSVCLITLRNGETETPIGVAATFRSAYKIALFEQAISFPNLSERAAQSIMNKQGIVYIWDTSKFDYEDAARWSPLGKMAILQKVPVKKS